MPENMIPSAHPYRMKLHVPTYVDQLRFALLKIREKIFVCKTADPSIWMCGIRTIVPSLSLSRPMHFASTSSSMNQQALNMQALLSLVFLAPLVNIKVAAVDMSLYQLSNGVETGFEGFLKE